ncbi:MAG: hypothetical protein M1821_004717 [Bathelium mastoideum]|nr:MAG: hypothetical protein M1821_004717 [Bathelium mastoideum]
MQSLTNIKDLLEQSIPHPPPDPTALLCCCGQRDCAFLQRARTSLDGLETDVQTAAKLGQALLVRHETYVADAEQERVRMTATIEKLERDKHDLETDNARTIEENQGLLDQLESLNTDLGDSDTQIKSLTATLHSTQEELHRLSALAARTEELERQLTDFEREHAQLQRTLSSTEEEEQTAVQRWKNAERTLSLLQDQMDQVEQEASNERKRHLDVVSRMERRRAVEKELELAAGRLKGAAAAKGVEQDGKKGDVVSSFVKDILADNANLQMGLVELREMLINSNDEVERLREQTMLQQPLDEAEEGNSLGEELGLGAARRPSSEVHVHHHYYPPTPNGEQAKNKTPALRRPRKKRNVVTSGYSTPSAPRDRPYGLTARSRSTTPSSTATILAQTSASVPQETAGTNRWSMQSSQTGTSSLISPLSSSPQSTSHRTSSIFERVFSEAAMDSSRPTSPESNDPGSPISDTPKRIRPPHPANRSFSAPLAFQPKGTRATPFITLETTSEEPSNHLTPQFDISPIDQTAYPDGDDAINSNDDDLTLSPTKFPTEAEALSPFTTSINNNDDPFTPRKPSLHRSSSHDSLLSISGMDIHTTQQPHSRLRSRPSHLLLLHPHSAAAPAPASLSAATATAAAVQPALALPPTDSHYSLRTVSADHAARAPTGAGSGSGSAGLGRRWWARWGGAPAPSSLTSPPPLGPPSTASSSTSSSSARRGRDAAGSESGGGGAGVALGLPELPTGERKAAKGRRPGVNQAGPLLGFRAEGQDGKGEVVVGMVDREGLREMLDEE